MRDEETGTWWQQVSGEAIFGPLKGHRLRSVAHDEVSFGLWKGEQPNGRVLKPDSNIDPAKYAPADWEQRMARVPVATRNTDQSLAPRTLVVGVRVGSASKAYPFDALVKQSPIIDEVGGVPILLILGKDGKSVRAFERSVDNRKLELFLKLGSSQLLMADTETGSEWDFTGKSISGQFSGRQLQKIAVLNDYWFDWKTYHPSTAVYELGER